MKLVNSINELAIYPVGTLFCPVSATAKARTGGLYRLGVSLNSNGIPAVGADQITDFYFTRLTPTLSTSNEFLAHNTTQRWSTVFGAGQFVVLEKSDVAALGKFCADAMNLPEVVIEDPRKTALKNGLRQLTIEGLRRVINYTGEMVLDDANYVDGKFCPLAIASGLDLWPGLRTNSQVRNTLTGVCGLKIDNTRNINGKFYTTDRKIDLITAAKEVLSEKLKPTAAVVNADFDVKA